MKNIFNPMVGLFTIDYQRRLEVSVESQVYEAKKKYIEVAQMKQHYDAEVAYHGGRLNMLVDMLAKLKGPEDAKNSSLTSVTIPSISNTIAR